MTDQPTVQDYLNKYSPPSAPVQVPMESQPQTVGDYLSKYSPPSAPDAPTSLPSDPNQGWSGLPNAAQDVGNVASGVIDTGIGATVALPDNLLRLGDKIGQYAKNKYNSFNGEPEVPYSPSPLIQLADNYLPTQEGSQNALYSGLGVPDFVPTGTAGKLTHIVPGVVATLGVGAIGDAAQAPNILTGLTQVARSTAPLATAATVGELAHEADPDNPILPLVAGAAGFRMAGKALAPGAPPPAYPVTAAQGKALATAHYQSSNAVYPASVTNAFHDQMNPMNLPDDATPTQINTAAASPLTPYAAIQANIRDQPLSLDDAQTHLQSVRDMGRQASIAENNVQAADIFNRLSKMKSILSNPDLSGVIGDPDAYQAIVNGNKAFQQASKLGDMEQIAKVASGAGNPASSIVSQLREIYNNNDTYNYGYSPDEIAAIKDVISPSLPSKIANASSYGLPLIGEILGAHSDALNPVVGGAMGAAAGVAGKLSTSALRNAAAQKGLANVVDVIGKNSPSPPQPAASAAVASPAPSPLALPAPPIIVPPGGFSQPASPLASVGAITTPVDPMANLKGLPNWTVDQTALGRALTYQPRPDFIGTENGQVDAVPNVQVGPYQFGSGAGIPMSPSEIKAQTIYLKQIAEMLGKQQ